MTFKTRRDQEHTGSLPSVLAIDTALCACAVAVSAESGSAARTESMRFGQAERLIPLIVDVAQEAGLGLRALSLILVTRGPGSFTGVRVGLSAARALGLAIDCPVRGMSVPDVLAAQYLEQIPHQETTRDTLCVMVALDTRRPEDVYVQTFTGYGVPLSPPLCLPDDRARTEILTLSRTTSVHIIGDGAERITRPWENPPPACVLRPDISHIDPAFMARYGANLWMTRQETEPADDETHPLQDPSPLYLRAADVSKPKAPLRRVKTDRH